MEAAGALGRGSLSTYREALGELVRSRSRTFWIVAGLTVLAAAVRFATLGLQSYHHDEVVTALRNAGFDTIEKVLEAEPDALAALPGFDAETIDAVRAAAEAERSAQSAAAPAEPEPEMEPAGGEAGDADEQTS